MFGLSRLEHWIIGVLILLMLVAVIVLAERGGFTAMFNDTLYRAERATKDPITGVITQPPAQPIGVATAFTSVGIVGLIIGIVIYVATNKAAKDKEPDQAAKDK